MWYDTRHEIHCENPSPRIDFFSKYLRCLKFYYYLFFSVFWKNKFSFVWYSLLDRVFRNFPFYLFFMRQSQLRGFFVLWNLMPTLLIFSGFSFFTTLFFLFLTKYNFKMFLNYYVFFLIIITKIILLKLVSI